jgi:hypothetical protein
MLRHRKMPFLLYLHYGTCSKRYNYFELKIKLSLEFHIFCRVSHTWKSLNIIKESFKNYNTDNRMIQIPTMRHKTLIDILFHTLLKVENKKLPLEFTRIQVL